MRGIKWQGTAACAVSLSAAVLLGCGGDDSGVDVDRVESARAAIERFCGPNSEVTAEGQGELKKHVDVLVAEFDKDPDQSITFDGQLGSEKNMFGVLHTQSRRLRDCAPEQEERVLQHLDAYSKSTEREKPPYAR
jgi:hypothetical protein